MTKILDGRALAKEIRSELKEEVDRITAAGGRRPHLVTILVGEDAPSQAYVRNKMRSCEKVGFKATLLKKPGDVSESELLDTIYGLNDNDGVDGFIVQLPLPNHIDEEKVTLAIAPHKDVDGFHPVNFGRMAQGMPCYQPATPFGIMEMIRRYDLATEGKEVVVVGRSNIVGTPMSLLLSRKGKPGNATVTLCHSRTADLAAHTRKADFIIAAIGRPGFITADMVKEGAVIIDVGINRVEDESRERGYRLEGDVDFDGLNGKVGYLTPVPGGVGQLTVVALLMNTLRAYKKEVY